MRILRRSTLTHSVQLIHTCSLARGWQLAIRTRRPSDDLLKVQGYTVIIRPQGDIARALASPSAQQLLPKEVRSQIKVMHGMTVLLSHLAYCCGFLAACISPRRRGQNGFGDEAHRWCERRGLLAKVTLPNRVSQSLMRACGTQLASHPQGDQRLLCARACRMRPRGPYIYLH